MLRAGCALGRLMPDKATSSMRADDLPTDLLIFDSLDETSILCGFEFDQLKLQPPECDDQAALPTIDASFPMTVDTSIYSFPGDICKSSNSHALPTPPTPTTPSPGSTPVAGSPPSMITSGSTSKVKVPRHKRESHINAEQRRRCKIQKGFEDLQKLVPAISEVVSSGNKDSKAAMLNKTLDYIRQIRSEKSLLSKEVEKLRKEAELLSNEISMYQNQLPEEGVELPRKEQPMQLNQMFEDYVRARTLQNWKFWIFGFIIRPLFESYQKAMSNCSIQELTDTVGGWMQQSCSLISLRPVVLGALRQLCSSTSIMETPERFPEEAVHSAISTHMPGDTPFS